MLLPLSCLFSFGVITDFVVTCLLVICRIKKKIERIFACDPHGESINLVAVQGKVVDVICFKISNLCKGFVAIFSTKYSFF